jgi:hypothetical protein
MILTGTRWRKKRRQNRVDLNTTKIRIADTAVASSVVDEFDNRDANSDYDLEEENNNLSSK